MKLSVILTCHNRRNKTIECLKSFYRQVPHPLLTEDPSVFLVDDGSTDGTSEAVSQLFPLINLIKGDGSLYWNRGMHLAFQYAEKNLGDFLLWLNDDVILDEDSLTCILSNAEKLLKSGLEEFILVGSFRDPSTGETTGGGRVRFKRSLSDIRLSIRSFIHLTYFEYVIPNNELQPCLTMCGHCVLISKKAVYKIGNLDPYFNHAAGDFDYGLRAEKLNVPRFVLPGWVGFSEKNHWDYSDIKHIETVKGFPYKERFHYYSRHKGFFWGFLWIFLPYLLTFVSFLKKKVFKKYFFRT